MHKSMLVAAASVAAVFTFAAPARATNFPVSGTITVSAKDDGIRGKDYLIIADGTVNVTAEGDGLKSDNEDDDTVGYVSIDGGTVEIAAGDEQAVVGEQAGLAVQHGEQGGVRQRL